MNLKKNFTFSDIYIRRFPFSVVFDKLIKHKVDSHYRWLKETEKWDLEQMQSYQYQQIKEVINEAYEFVPYYKKVFKEIGFEPGDFKSLDDLKLLPTIDKETVKSNYKDFLSVRATPKLIEKFYTGGSTDKPMEFYVDKEKSRNELAYFYYIWEKYGYKIGERCVFIKADKLSKVEKNIFHKYDNIYNYLRLDSDYLNQQEYLQFYDKAIKNFHAKVLFGYASSIYQLAKLYAASNIAPPVFDLVLMASENTYPEQTKFVKDVFQSKDVFYHYGHSEQLLLGYKYTDNDKIGFLPQYGYLEILDEKGNSKSQNGEYGEIVGTGYSKYMPFIRYRTKDFATVSDYASNDFMKTCKSVERIEGRLHEFLVTKDKRLVSSVSMAGAHFKELAKVQDMQFVQSEEGKLELRFVEDSKSPLTLEDKNNILIQINNKLENSVEVSLTKVDKIERTKLNKKRMIIQKLDITKYFS